MIAHAISKPSAETLGDVIILREYYPSGKEVKVLVGLPAAYEDLDALSRAVYNIPRVYRITFHTNDLDICGGADLTLHKSSWQLIRHALTTVTVRIDLTDLDDISMDDGEVDSSTEEGDEDIEDVVEDVESNTGNDQEHDIGRESDQENPYASQADENLADPTPGSIDGLAVHGQHIEAHEGATVDQGVQTGNENDEAAGGPISRAYPRGESINTATTASAFLRPGITTNAGTIHGNERGEGRTGDLHDTLEKRPFVFSPSQSTFTYMWPVQGDKNKNTGCSQSPEDDSQHSACGHRDPAKESSFEMKVDVRNDLEDVRTDASPSTEGETSSKSKNLEPYLSVRIDPSAIVPGAALRSRAGDVEIFRRVPVDKGRRKYRRLMFPGAYDCESDVEEEFGSTWD